MLYFFMTTPTRVFHWQEPITLKLGMCTPCDHKSINNLLWLWVCLATHKILMERVRLVKKSNQVKQNLIETPKYKHSHTHRRLTHFLVTCWTNQAEIWHVGFMWPWMLLPTCVCGYGCGVPINSIKVWIPIRRNILFKLLPANLVLVKYTTFILCCTNTMQRSGNRPTDHNIGK